VNLLDDDVNTIKERKETLRLVRTRRRWVDNIKMDLGETGWDGRDWI
jgi:hypothetical protein